MDGSGGAASRHGNPLPPGEQPGLGVGVPNRNPRCREVISNPIFGLLSKSIIAGNKVPRPSRGPVQ